LLQVVVVAVVVVAVAVVAVVVVISHNSSNKKIGFNSGLRNMLPPKLSGAATGYICFYFTFTLVFCNQRLLGKMKIGSAHHVHL